MNDNEPTSPFSNDKDAFEPLTVARLKKMLESIPDDYMVGFDNAAVVPKKGDLTIYPESKIVSING